MVVALQALRTKVANAPMRREAILKTAPKYVLKVTGKTPKHAPMRIVAETARLGEYATQGHPSKMCSAKPGSSRIALAVLLGDFKTATTVAETLEGANATA